jgi:geranylgeranyl reductase family protein
MGRAIASRHSMRAIVVGAGPAGATAALVLARSGAAVTMIDKNAWPREKTCGDGVSPLAIRELARLGVPFEQGLRLRSALIATPAGTEFRGGWPDATPWGTIVTRHDFDAALVDAAVAAGVTFLQQTGVRDVATGADEVVVTLDPAAGPDNSLRADAVIVADGATGTLPARLGFPPYRSRLVALRAYADARTPLTEEYGIFYDRSVTPGYGWIFPLSRDRANVGVCVDERVLKRAGGNLRELLKRWLNENAAARAYFGPDPELTGVQGGIIPSGRARRAMGRVLLAGDAAGVADPFTAEGICESISSGELAARALIESPDVATAAKRYERALRELDRNATAARILRATFDAVIEPYAWYAARRRRFADRLTTAVFFAKPDWLRFVWRMHIG